MKRRFLSAATGSVAAVLLACGGALPASAATTPLPTPPPPVIEPSQPGPPLVPPGKRQDGPGTGLCRLLPWFCDR